MKKNKIIFWTATIIIALMEAVMPIGTWIFAPAVYDFWYKSTFLP